MTITNAINANSLTPLPAVNGGSGVSNPTAHGILIAEGASAYTPIVLTAGQVLIGTTASDPVGATLTAGSGISISSVSGGITITNTGVAASWVDQTTTPVTITANTNYIADKSTLITFNVPATVAQGTVFQIAGAGSGGWLIQFNTGQTGHLNSTATTSAGSFASTNQYNCISILCTAANTTFTVIQSSGTITVA